MPRKSRMDDIDEVFDIPKKKARSKQPPARTPGERENRMINLAMDLIEKRLREGTASAQETTLFAKLGTSPERLDKELKEKQKQLFDAKTESLKQSKVNQDLMAEALAAIKVYRGQGPEEPDDEE